MTRRKFMTLLGGAATWPLAARGQPVESPRRIGVLLVGLLQPAGPDAIDAFLVFLPFCW